MMRPRPIPMRLLLILLLSLMISLSTATPSTSPTSSSTLLDHGDPCNPNPLELNTGNPNNLNLYQHSGPSLCNPSKRLSCDPVTHRCICHHEDRDVYDEEGKRCETKVGKFCDSSPSPPQDTTSICVGQAICNGTTKFCECPHGYETNEEGNECSQSSNFFLSTIAIFLLLISCFVL